MNAKQPIGDLFAGSGEMAALMRATDWSKTRLGPVETWPQSLRTMLGVVLGSRFPMLLWWGPDLLHLYNDAFRPILRDKHPASLGAPAAEVWAEVWDFAGPLARGVQEGGPATWMEDVQLFISSAEMAEETYFTFSYSPVPGDDGRVGGVLNTVQETTAKVQGARQIRMLHDLSDGCAESRSEADTWRRAVEVLSAYELDLPFVLVYVVGADPTVATLVASCGVGDGGSPARPERVPLAAPSSATGWPLSEARRADGEPLVVDLTERFGSLPPGRWGARPERALVLPLTRVGQSAPYAFVVAGVSPHRALDDRYLGLFRATAAQLANVVTNAVAYEAESRRAASLAEIDQAKTAFFSNISHEFRTPLTLILGPVEDAIRRPTGALAGPDLEAVHRNALRLLRLVNTLLDFSRAEAGRQHVSFAPTDLAALTAALASSFHSLVVGAGVQLVIDCPPLSEPVYVDPLQWEKVVLNLISNAFKFTLSGEIAVRLRAEGDAVVLRVSDTGTGIPPEALPRIFQRFSRVEGVNGRSIEGSGIGLALVRDVAELHGGEVSVESAFGKGSTFSVRIPRGKAHLPATKVAEEPGWSHASEATPYVLEAERWVDGQARQRVPVWSVAAEPSASTSSTEVATADRAHLLVVDDNPDMLAYLERLLSPHYTLTTARDGVEGLAAALADPPALVLSDVMMPRMNGFQLVAALRAAEATRYVPTVLLSARAGEEAMVGGLETGADDYIVKPFSARELLSRVRTHLKLAEERRRSALVAEELARTRATMVERLRQKNEELAAFSYSVAHDLRGPLHAIDGFSQALVDDYAASLPAPALGYLMRVRNTTKRMAQIIDDMMELSRVDGLELVSTEVDLSALASAVAAELRGRDPSRTVEVRVAPGVRAMGDQRLFRVMLENLIGNALKFTGKALSPKVEFGVESSADEPQFFVRDNGAGFDQAFADKLFTPFTRLHSQTEFPGTGIGLATVARVVTRHGGRVWAEGAVGKGATVRFTLGAPVASP